MKPQLTREQELILFRKICNGSLDRVTGHQNIVGDRGIRAGRANQGMQRGKLRAYVREYGNNLDKLGAIR